MSDSSAESAQAPAPITVVSGLMILGLLIVALAVFEYCGITMIHMGVEVFFASYLLLWHWATVEKNEFGRLAHSVVGALVGLALAWQSGWCVGHFQTPTPIFGLPAGLFIGLTPVIIALFLVIMNWIPVAFNSSTMLFVTVLGAPALAKGAKFVELGEAVVIGAIFFAVVVWLALQYVQWRGKAKAAKAARTTGGKGAVTA